jgi:hypothetical protein
MKKITDEFISNLKTKIDEINLGKDVEYQTNDVTLKSDVSK